MAPRVPGKVRPAKELAEILDVAVQVAGDQHLAGVFENHEMSPAARGVVVTVEVTAAAGVNACALWIAGSVREAASAVAIRTLRAVRGVDTLAPDGVEEWG